MWPTQRKYHSLERKQIQNFFIIFGSEICWSNFVCSEWRRNCVFYKNKNIVRIWTPRIRAFLWTYWEFLCCVGLCLCVFRAVLILSRILFSPHSMVSFSLPLSGSCSSRGGRGGQDGPSSRKQIQVVSLISLVQKNGNLTSRSELVHFWEQVPTLHLLF